MSDSLASDGASRSRATRSGEGGAAAGITAGVRSRYIRWIGAAESLLNQFASTAINAVAADA